MSGKVKRGFTQEIIYHGSPYETKKIQPGFNLSKVLITLDETENNTYLYATKDKTEAIILGFFSGIEKRYGAIKFVHSELSLDIYFENKPPELIPFNIYLYECELTENWEQVNNKSNLLTDEYKTKDIITPLTCTKIKVFDWLKKHNYVVKLNIIKE